MSEVSSAPAHQAPRSKWTERYGQWAVVTGASGGIGEHFARQAASRGLNLVLAARSGDKLKKLATDLERHHGIETRVIAVDLSENSAVDDLLRATTDLDIGLLIANAGYATTGDLIDNSIEDERRMFDLNTRTVLTMTHDFANRFARRGSGGIVLVSSLLGFQGVPRSANYAAAKAYVQTLAEGLRTELKARGVDLIVAAPGPVKTGFAERADMQMGLMGRPETVARVTLDQLGRKTTVRPGFVAKFLESGLALLPRRGRTAILTQIMYGMTKHQDASGKEASKAPNPT